MVQCANFFEKNSRVSMSIIFERPAVSNENSKHSIPNVLSILVGVRIEV
jgi:hypothetical protein